MNEQNEFNGGKPLTAPLTADDMQAEQALKDMFDNIRQDRIKATGLAYKVFAETCLSYYKKGKTGYFDQFEFTKELHEKGNQMYQQDKNFPVKFYHDMSNVVIEWFLTGFKYQDDQQLYTVFQSLWKLHRQYVGRVLTVDDFSHLIDEGNAWVDVILHRNRKGGQTNVSASPSENGKPQTPDMSDPRSEYLAKLFCAVAENIEIEDRKLAAEMNAAKGRKDTKA